MRWECVCVWGVFVCDTRLDLDLFLISGILQMASGFSQGLISDVTSA